MNNIFKIKKEERLFALIALIIIIAFNVLMITYHFEDFGKPKAGFWTLFTKNFQISGFDPYTYLTLSKWKVYYTEYRHPMLPFFLYPFSVLNGWLIELTSRNWATTIVAVMMTFFSTYSILFFRRIFSEVMQLKAIDSNVLTAMLFSFAYVLLVTFVDDHFGMSLFFLSMTLYIAGKENDSLLRKQQKTAPLGQKWNRNKSTIRLSLARKSRNEACFHGLICLSPVLNHW